MEIVYLIRKQFSTDFNDRLEGYTTEVIGTLVPYSINKSDPP